MGNNSIIGGRAVGGTGRSDSKFKQELLQKVESRVFQKVWEVHSKPQQMALESVADIILYGGSAGSLKALTLDTHIPTPSGWTTMGELRVGSEVLDENGVPCRVISLSPIFIDKKVYEVIFDDGSVVKACGDHRWQTMNELERLRSLRQTDAWRARRRARRASRGIGKRPDLAARNAARASLKTKPERGMVRTTDELRATLYGRDGRPNHSIDVAGALQLPDASLPIDPYVLGVWLGDGHSKGACLTTDDPEILYEIEKAGHSLKKYSTKYEWGISGLHKPLRESGLIRNKHIPPVYLRASYEQRVALLQGLMDTDGTASRKRGCVFYNTNKELVEQVLELILSLGIRASISSWTAKCNGKDCGPAYAISFVCDFPAFRLPRKLENQKRRERSTAKRRYIVDIREIPSQPTRCITVDSPSHLYLCSRSFIPTHNTETLLVAATAEIDNPNFHGIIFRASYPELRDIIKKSRRLYPQLGGKFTDGSPKRWVFPSGAVIEFTYLKRDDDVYDHQGQEYSFIGFDEAGHQNEFRIRYMLTRLRSTDKTLKLRMFLTANPGGPGHDFLMKFFLKGYCPHCSPDKAVESGKLYWDAVWPSDGQPVRVTLDDGTVVNKSVCFIAGKITDHNLLGNDYIGNLKMQSAATASILLSGCWKQWEGQFFDCYQETRGWAQNEFGTLAVADPDACQVMSYADILKYFEIKHWFAHAVGGDYGFAGSSAAAHLIVRTPATQRFPNGRIIVLDEYVQPHVTAKDFATDLLNKWYLEDGRIPEKPRNLQMLAVSPDAFRKDGSVNDVDVPFSRLEQMNAVLGNYGLEFIMANNDRLGGWMLMYQMLRDGELIICSHCEKTRDMLMSRTKDKKKFGDIAKVPGDELDDVADSLRYAVMTWRTVAVKPREERLQEITRDLDPTSAMIAVKRFELEERIHAPVQWIGKPKRQQSRGFGISPRRTW